MPSIKAISTSPTSALPWDLSSVSANTIAPFGNNPYTFTAVVDPVPVVPTGRLSKWMKRFREQIAPRLIAEINESQVTLVYRFRVYPDPDNPLETQTVEIEQAVSAIIFGANADNLETRFLSEVNQIVMIAAHGLDREVTPEVGVKIDGVTYDAIMVKPLPTRPGAVAYHIGIKRMG